MELPRNHFATISPSEGRGEGGPGAAKSRGRRALFLVLFSTRGRHERTTGTDQPPAAGPHRRLLSAETGGLGSADDLGERRLCVQTAPFPLPIPETLHVPGPGSYPPLPPPSPPGHERIGSTEEPCCGRRGSSGPGQLEVHGECRKRLPAFPELTVPRPVNAPERHDGRTQALRQDAPRTP